MYPIYLLFFLMALTGGTGAAAVAVTPELPREYVDTTLDPAYDRPADIVVGAGDDLQAALNQVQPGQILELEAGATFSGNFKLPRKKGTTWIYIRSSQYESLPAPGQRVGPKQARLMPNIVSPNSDPAIFTIYDAHHYRFIGIEIMTSAVNTNLVLFGFGLDSENDPLWMKQRADTVDEFPEHITFDRCYIHSNSKVNKARTGIFGDGKHIAVVDSTLSNFKDGADAQAFKAAQGPGPYKLVNNFLEATGENVMFGGESAAILTGDVLSADIEIRGNHFSKRWSWCEFLGCGGSDRWSVKNLLELKQGKRVLISGNIFENNWADAQSGKAILFKPTNQTGNMPWATVEDVTFKNNIVRHTGRGIQITGGSAVAGKASGQTRRILIRNNIIEDVSRAYSGLSRFLEISSSTDSQPILDLEISHNLFLFPSAEIGYSAMTVHSPDAADNLSFENNIIQHGEYGIGIPRLTGFHTFTKNAIVRKPGERSYLYYSNQANFKNVYGTENFNVDGVEALGFLDFRQGDYRLSAKSPYKNAASDGTDIGPDVEALHKAVFGKGPDSLGAPTHLIARLISSTVVELSWEDNSRETAFRLSRKVGNSAWEVWGDVPANTTKTRVGGLEPGQTYSFAVHARRGSAFSPSSNVIKLTMPRKGSGENPDDGLVAPRKLKGWVVSPTKGRLRWKDKSKNEKAFEVWIRIGEGEWRPFLKNPANKRRLKFSGAAQGAQYSFRVRARRGAERSGWSNTASVTMPGG